MKTLVNFEANSEFESAKTELEKFSDYAALSEQEREVHVKEIPNMVDIALWDATEEKILMIRGWEYNADVYPLDRYTPIGVEVIPRSHMDDGYSRIMSLNWMRYDTPNVGGDKQFIAWGLFNYSIENVVYNTTIPCINESGVNDLGETQKIKRWLNTNDGFKYFPSDSFDGTRYLNNPFTNGESYGITFSSSTNYLPSPYIQNMTKNPIFYTENPTLGNSSCLIDMNGKEETEKILNQIEKNGNTEWKTSESIENEGRSNMIAPAAQCCWMYSTVGTNQSDWYLPTLGELVYLLSRRGAINNTMKRINSIQGNNTCHVLNFGAIWSSTSCNIQSAIHLDLLEGRCGCSGKYIGDGYLVRAYMKI